MCSGSEGGEFTSKLVRVATASAGTQWPMLSDSTTRATRFRRGLL
jgi:hypothetical protein